MLLAGTEAEHCGKSNPVGILAVDIATVDQIHVEFVDWAPAQSDLKPRLSYPDSLLSCAELTEHLGGQLPDIVGRPPVDAGAIGCVMLPGNTIPLPTSIQVDAHDIRQPQCRRNSDENGCGFLVCKIVDNRP